MRKKINAGARAPSKTYVLLSSPVLSQTVPLGTYRSLLVDFLGDCPSEDLHAALDKLANVGKFRHLYSATMDRIHDAAVRGLIVGGLPLARSWEIALHTIKRGAEKLRRFEEHRFAVEHHIICGSFLAALDLITQKTDDFGESLWHVRIKLLLLSELKRLDELAAYCDTLQLATDKTLISTLLHFARLLTDSDSPLPVLHKLVASASYELRLTRYKDIASLIDLLYTPQPLIASRDYWSALHLLHAFPLIDQYILLERILEFAYVDGKDLPIEKLYETVAELSQETRLSTLLHLTRSREKNSESSSTVTDARLVELYEGGTGISLARYYNEEFPRMSNPLAYINMVAKSQASGVTVDEPIRSPIINRLVRNLRDIYAMDSAANNAEEAIKSMVVRYNSLRWSPQVQLALYAALPWRYEQRGRQFAARQALVMTDEITALASTIADSNCLEDELIPISNSAIVPEYRLLKSQCVSEIAQDAHSSRCAQKIEEYARVETRVKDRIEIMSLYFLKSHQHDRLLLMAAEELVKCETAHLVLPMERLIQLIEDAPYCDRSAVIIAFYYNRYVSQQKDYVLNEAFDDYLSENNVDRPSNLLKNAVALDALDAIFYRDICVPEVLDYLSSFSSIHELYAERIKIIDLLSERELMDSDARSAEVEEIVSRVIIDTAATNLNRAKISVDESALRKSVKIEVASLVNLFHQTEDTNDDRFTITPEQMITGKTLGYLSGARNAIILRICNHVMEAFMFDEKSGLDKTLSGEIRHGFFYNLMHARLEERKLLAETDVSGQYRPNEHWREIYHLLGPGAMGEIEKVLNTFGEDLNALIAEAEGWMQIKNGTDGSSGYFDNQLLKDDFDSIRNFVNESSDPEAVCNFIFQVMWTSIETSLKNIRDKLNGDFRNSVDMLFQDLENKLVQLKGTVALAELMGAVAQVRDGVRDDISTAAEWFRRAEMSEIRAGTLDKAVAIAINSFERVKGAVFAIETMLAADFEKVEIPNLHVKPLILAVVNLLDNAYRHSGLWSRTQVRIDGTFSHGTATITISNDLSLEKAANLTEEILSAIRSKISNAASINLVRTEGGSGLVKAFNGIVGLGAALDVSRLDDRFAAMVHYGA